MNIQSNIYYNIRYQKWFNKLEYNQGIIFDTKNCNSSNRDYKFLLTIIIYLLRYSLRSIFI